MDTIRRLIAATNKNAVCGLLAVALAVGGTFAGPAPRVTDIGTPWSAELDKTSGLDKRNEFGKSGELSKQSEFDKKDSLAAKSDGTMMDKPNSLGVEQL